MHKSRLITAHPMRTPSRADTGCNASVGHAAMQGKSAHKRHAWARASITGVPVSAPVGPFAMRIAWQGHASKQRPHLMQRARKSASFAAPGGRRSSSPLPAKQTAMPPAATPAAAIAPSVVVSISHPQWPKSLQIALFDRKLPAKRDGSRYIYGDDSSNSGDREALDGDA